MWLSPSKYIELEVEKNQLREGVAGCFVCAISNPTSDSQ